VRVFGIDPGSVRTGYGCVETDGTRHRLITCGALSAPAGSSLPDRLRLIHDRLLELLTESAPACVAIESLFHARNVKSALTLGHARGVAVLATVEAGVPLVEYAPAEIKQALVGNGRAEKAQVQHMVTLLLGLDTPPSPFDASDALAIAICHAHASGGALPTSPRVRPSRAERSWRHVNLAALGRRPVQ
jgi:crossover junction endodeoxyribonuclease RuvC